MTAAVRLIQEKEKEKKRKQKGSGTRKQKGKVVAVNICRTGLNKETQAGSFVITYAFPPLQSLDQG